jgi:hypothetical protein
MGGSQTSCLVESTSGVSIGNVLNNYHGNLALANRVSSDVRHGASGRFAIKSRLTRFSLVAALTMFFRTACGECPACRPDA